MSTMLAQATSRAMRMPALRNSAASFRAASSPQWTRGLANNHRRGVPKKDNTYAKPTGSTPPSKASSIGSASFGAQNSASALRPGETPKPDHLKSSTAGEAENAGKGTDPAITGEKEESNTASNNQPLPDLTQGIPSTWEFEAAAAREAAGTSLNLTEDPTKSSGGGRSRGELPASAYISSSEKKRLRFANYMYAAAAASIVGGYIYLGRNWESDEEERRYPDSPSGWALGLMWNRAKARMVGQLNYYNEPAFTKLLPDPDPSFERPYTLVLSLEDLLIHSEWSREHGWRMAKRPGVDYFLRYLSQYYELVIFTTVPWATGEPVIRKLDPYHIVTWPLYREATFYKNGEYIKDLSYLNRDLSKVILLDTVESHGKAQPENSIIIPKWNGDPKDKELVSFIPFLEYLPTMATADVRKALESFKGTHIPSEFAKREAVARKRFQDQLSEEQKRRPKSGLGFLSNALGVKPMMQYEGEQSPAEAFAQGKMLQDQARERGQKNYEALEKMIREEGEKWLAEEKIAEEKAKEEGMKAMKSGFTGFFGGGAKPT